MRAAAARARARGLSAARVAGGGRAIACRIFRQRIGTAAASGEAGGGSGSGGDRGGVLFFGGYWPDRNATGAGVRTTSLMEAFVSRWGYAKVSFASPARENEASRRLGERYETLRCEMNRREPLLALLRDAAPSVCLFDKFTAEEQYSWAVRLAAPGALRVLDMQDSHALRLWCQAEVEARKKAHRARAIERSKQRKRARGHGGREEAEEHREDRREGVDYKSHKDLTRAVLLKVA